MFLIKIFLGTLLTFLCIGWVYERLASDIEELNKPPFLGKLIDVGGYKLHLQDQGEGQATVILESGMGLSSLDWALVQPEVAKFTRVISYDRAGLGWSEESPNPRTAEHIVTELYTLLKNAEIPGPYILVGHSMGGIYTRLFASRYPDEVEGLVLIDASHEEMNERLPEDPNMHRNLIQKFFRNFGIQRFFISLPSTQKLFDELYRPYPPSVRYIYQTLQMTGQTFRVTNKENECCDESLKQLKKTPSLLTNIPLVVITAGHLSFVADQFGYQKKWVDDTYDVWKVLQKEHVSLSRRSKQKIAEKSDHMIPRHQPELIVQAIRDIIENNL